MTDNNPQSTPEFNFQKDETLLSDFLHKLAHFLGINKKIKKTLKLIPILKRPGEPDELVIWICAKEGCGED